MLGTTAWLMVHETKDNMSINEIASKLTEAGCKVSEWKGSRVYVKKTPNGPSGDYGYCVEGDDVRDIVENITKRAGEISEILRK